MNWFITEFRVVSQASFSFFLRIRIGVGFWTVLRVEKSHPLPFLSLSLSLSSESESFSTPHLFSSRTNECKRRRPTDRQEKERERCASAREKTKEKSRKITQENLPLWEREKNRAQKRVTYVSYLDDDAQTSRGWCNPPGASPDTINRSSRPRLSRAYRRCPELRSLTRTPFTKICKVISLDMCVRV